VRSIVPVGARSCLAVMLACSLLNLPAMAASEKPLAVVVTADHARLDNAAATIGADVFSGDALVTDRGGSLRLTAGSSQVYLLSASSATLVPHDGRVQTRVNLGTVGFSTSTPGQLEIQTPLGLIRGADSKAIFGQVSVVSPTKMRVSSYEGTLVVADATGAEKTIEAGETYEASLTPEPKGDNNPPPKGVTGTGINWSHVADVAIPLMAAGVLACALWPESPSQLGCWNN
jgi:hypothetical protein